MSKFNYIFYFYLLLFFNNFHLSKSVIQCYLCADCSDPFDPKYPYTTIITNQNIGASCIKTILTTSTSRVVSRGTTFDCTPGSTSDNRIYCCSTDLCNRSNSLKQIIFLLIFPIFYTFYLLSH